MSLQVGVNSYLDVAAANAYFSDRLGAEAWDALTDAQKSQALVTATRRLERLPYVGAKKDQAQALQFPRCYPPTGLPLVPSDSSFDDLLYAGWYCESDVPQAIKDAVCEEALALVSIGKSQRLELQAQGVRSLSLGRLSESYGPPPKGLGGLLSLEARELLRPYVAGAVGIV